MKRILIDSLGEAVRTAFMEDERLKEIFIDKKKDGSMVGQVILGTVRNILPSQFAFIDIGYEKNAFMNMPPNAALKVGQPVLVQVQKDATGSKGANVSEYLHFNGRLAIVYASPRKEIGISQKITDKEERKRLRHVAEAALPEGYGAILRTNSAHHEEKDIGEDILRLAALHQSVMEQAHFKKPPALLYREKPLLNDLLSDDIGEIWVNEPGEYAAVKQAVEATAPLLTEKVLYFEQTDEIGLFAENSVENQIERALRRNVWLPCGGFVTFEQTEACVIVDVNTGKFAGKRNRRETVLQTNLEAAVCIAEQIALRNLSGMIIVDFIDMREEADKDTLVRRFSYEIKKDRIKTAIVGMTELGLVQLTRKKTRESLSRLLETECPCCHGTGRIPLT